MRKEELEIISRRFEDKLAQLMPQEEFLPFVRCVVEEARLMVENANGYCHDAERRESND